MNSIVAFTGARYDELLSWARYLYWSELHRRRYDAWLEKHPPKTSQGTDWRLIALMSAFYASLWVVIEGWQAAALHDEMIDRIIKASPRYLRLLKRFRNGVFHYQSSLTDNRFVLFLDGGRTAMLWAYFIHDEFKRYLWELFRNVKVPETTKRRLKTSVRRLIGWVPVDPVLQKADDLRKRSEKTIKMLESRGELSSPAAVDLLHASRNTIAVANEGEVNYAKWKAEFFLEIERSGGEPDSA